MSKTVAAGFQSRSTHFIMTGIGARQTGGARASGQGREGTVGGAEGTEDTGQEYPTLGSEHTDYGDISANARAHEKDAV